MVADPPPPPPGGDQAFLTCHRDMAPDPLRSECCFHMLAAISPSVQATSKAGRCERVRVRVNWDLPASGHMAQSLPVLDLGAILLRAPTSHCVVVIAAGHPMRIRIPGMRQMKLCGTSRPDSATAARLLCGRWSLEVGVASTMRKQELMFAHPQAAAMRETSTLSAKAWSRCLQDGFGFLRSAGCELTCRDRTTSMSAVANPALRAAHQ